jgi:hypothetical protein
MPLILPSNSISAVGYEVDNSLRFNSGSSDSLSKAFSSNGTRTKWTWSIWFKRSKLSGSNVLGACYFNDSNEDRLEIDSNGQMIWYSYQSNSYVGRLKTNRKFRDISAWYHLVLRWDTGDSTADNRMKIWINGVEETSFAIRNNPSSDAESLFNYGNGSQQWVIGHTANVNHWGGYMAEIVFCDNQKLDPTSFGEFDEDTGIWKPIDVSGLTFGTNGFYLDFENSGSLGADVSGNGNNFTVNNLTSIDQTTDTPTNNYCTLNPLSKGTITLAEGNLQWQGSGDNGGKGTFLITKGKWYWEMKRADSEDNVGLGVAISNWTNSVNSASGEAWYGYQGQAYKVSGTGGEVSYGTSFSNNDIVSVLFDADNGNLAFYVNGSSQGTAFTGLTDSEGYVPIYFTYRTSVTNYMNFGSPIHSISSGNSDANGHGNFEYAVPSGYYSLNTKNLSEFG